MKNILLILAGLIALLIVIVFAANVFSNGNSLFAKTGTVKINDETFTVEEAKTDEARQIGLSKKSSLAEDRGMIFLFDSAGYYPFWMKNMKFPIDIIFIKDTKIVTIHKDVQPPTTSDDQNLILYNSDEPADKVLELHAGQAEKYNIQKGDTVDLSL